MVLSRRTMKKQVKIYCKENTLYKIKYIALQTGTSQTGLFEQAITDLITTYETKYGVITVPDPQELGGGTNKFKES